jgi:hypothetical protein
MKRTINMNTTGVNTNRYNTLNMRSAFLAIIFLAFGFTFATAQNGQRIKGKLRSERAAVYTDVLQLTPEEAQQFWPVFNQFIDEREKVQQELKSLKRDNLSDAEAEAQIKKQIELQQRDLDLEKDVIQKLRKVISLQKIIKIPDAEREFRQTVLARAKDKAVERKRMNGN